MGGIDPERFLRLVRGEIKGPTASAARMGLGLAAAAYGLGVAARNAAFDRGLKAVHRARVPVVSVGNLTLGGTGKTPMVEWLARWYRARDVRVCLISRGYGRADAVNDEALVLEENLPDVPHLQDPDRVRLAEIAVDELETELIVLDDGFQHRRLARDLDLVLLDALDPFGLGRLFPRGLLREPATSLKRADAVIVTRADLAPADRLAAIRSEVRRRNATIPILEARHAPRDLVDGDGSASSLDGLDGREVAAFCGLGNPEGFRRSLESLGCRIADLRVFPDHHPYSAEDVADLVRWAGASGANLVLTTQKDLVKLRLSNLGDAPLRALRIGLELLDDARPLEDLLAALLPESRPVADA
ncbi:tetraacyldisaccharide 4'-kinase [Planctomyces sp. SH-PL62]|uniref:tetraacyldisaccharide 4'-kinase n=1 Tax=Planctomyces sp. SH-PL62 TaxID=1636152 RepID=UPI00078D305B|nr:tetraacyldisaccharide 4'-kinase [Planctomyces sp. SH-PL62]AMV39836.1 Tetraacyldisaccharide 4'-kinase [Planctomyces sp. SH-PL62]